MAAFLVFLGYIVLAIIIIWIGQESMRPRKEFWDKINKKK